MSSDRQKDEELWAVEAARIAGLPLPPGEIAVREKPDFEIRTGNGLLGLEVTEFLPPPQNPSFNSALAECAMEADVIRKAEEMYRRIPGATPVKVSAHFWDFQRKRSEERRLVKELVQFVADHRPIVSRTATFARMDGIPDGFGVISITTEDGEWFGGGRDSLTLSGLRAAFAQRIADKNNRIKVYRKNMPDAPIWLLLFSGAGLPGGIETFVGIEKCDMTFGFDRIFFYSALAGRVVEIQRSSMLPHETDGFACRRSW